MPTITDEMVETLNMRLATAGNPLRITKGSGRNIDYDSRIVFEKPNPTLAPVVADQHTYINCGSLTQQRNVSVKTTLESKYTWNIKAGLKIGASVEVEAGVIFAKAKTNASIELSLEGGKEESKTETIEFLIEFPLLIPPMTKSLMQAIVQQEKVENLPFTANVILIRGIFKATPAETLPFYRYYNTGNGDHFYTTNYDELRGGGGDWQAEGVAGYILPSPKADTTPLYRYYNTGNEGHFYTTNSKELVVGGTNWNYEGVVGHIFPTPQPNTVAFHRYYNTNNRGHFYTTNFNELGERARDWRYEGIIGYIFPDNIDLDITSVLPVEDRTFYVQGRFGGKLTTRSSQIFILETPMTKKECGAMPKQPAPPGSKPQPKQTFYVIKTPLKELPKVDLLLNKPGVKKIKARSK